MEFPDQSRTDLVLTARDPEIRLRDIAVALGITERSAHSVVRDLTDSGYVLKRKDGRRNSYKVQTDRPLPEVGHELTIGEMLDVLVGAEISHGSREQGA